MNQQAPNIQTCQIIAAALMMGVIAFGGVTLAMHFGQETPAAVEDMELPGNDQGILPETVSVLLLVLFCFIGGALIGRFVMFGVFDRQLLNEFGMDREPPLTTEDCLGRYQTRLIVGMALLEGPAFFALIVFMLEGRWEAFGVAVFLLLLMAINFPTQTKFAHWIETARLNSGTTIGE